MFRQNKKYSSKNRNGRVFRRRLVYILLLLAILVLGALEATNTTHIFHKAPKLTKEGVSSQSQTGSKSSASKPSASQSQPAASQTGQGITQTRATDTNGQTAASTTPSQWTTSASGLITLKSPVANSVFKSGSAISGTAKVSQVWYRLVDDQSGVISQGQPLKVVNGKFSGTLTFHAYGHSGHLDVFSFSNSGAEVNEVSVNLRF